MAHERTQIVDIVGRLGGEECAVLLPRTHSREGAVIARRLKEAISIAARDVGDHQVRGTLGLGVAVVLGGETAIGEAWSEPMPRSTTPS
ncbi:diguanylate cyclase (GGDEF)-like protein [Mesorhizobium robiniae]|uniref:Diguanylate cyclase (GGDEF)-like protein n=1 Tax=Mesorhizobium robiniae TaxID=559315 RepID=A0ABV2GNI5_9HYPH